MKNLLFALAVAAFTIPTQALAVDSVITPEPGTVGLMVAGLAGIGIAAWRRNRNKEERLRAQRMAAGESQPMEKR
jgi:Na+/glutamate symporter